MLVVPWAAVVAMLSVLVGAAGAVQASCLLPPVAAPVVDPYREPGCAWCPGNRGVTYGVPEGTVVRAAGAGTVTFSGVVAGTRYVVVEHVSGGLRATYGGLASASVGAGDPVLAGGVVGTATGELHFGLRRGDTYVDPTPLLGRLAPRARLVPTDGTPPRPPPPPRLDCSGAGAPPAAGAGSAAAGAGAAGGASLPLLGVDPSAWRAGHHDYPAIDVLVPPGTPVLAWRSGTVRRTHDDPRNCAATAGGRRCPAPCGIGITVVDGTWPAVTWTYCHLSALEVRAGDTLTAGQRVGRSGNSGRSGAPHLHLEVRVGGERVCPQGALSALATTGRLPDPRRLPRSGCSS